MKNIWLISDRHLYHTNIIKYCARPFEDADKMTEALRTSFNELVKEGDLVYDLGDATMLRQAKDEERFIEEQLKWNGRWHLIPGNHDHFPPETYIKAGYKKIMGTGQWHGNMMWSHFPVHPSAIGSATACVHGHIHDSAEIEPFVTKEGIVKPYVCVCVEKTDYKPIHLDEVLTRIKVIKESYDKKPDEALPQTNCST